MTPPIVVIVPYGGGPGGPALLAECLRSIAEQDYPCFAACVVVDGDDAARPLVGRGIDDWWKASPFGRVSWGAVRRATRGGELASVIAGTAALEKWAGYCAAHFPPMTDTTVICHVSGDDLLASPSALSRLAREYEDPDAWLTYGQYVVTPSGEPGACRQIPPEWHAQADYRRREWVTSHLRSYRLGLWRRIPPEQLVDPHTGEPWFYATDRAMMLPMLEMAGADHARFIPDVLYCWRRHDGNVTTMQDADHCRRVADMPVVQRLETIYGASSSCD